MGGGFWDLAGKLGTMAALIGICTALYQTWVPDAALQRNHHRLAAFVAWGGRAGWLETLQTGVTVALRLLTKLYGEPAESQSGIRAFLTVEAWKVSARIAAFIVLPLPAFMAAIALLFNPGDAERIDQIKGILVFIGLGLALIWPFYLTRHFREEHAPRHWRQQWATISDSTAGSAAVITLLASVFGGTMMIQQVYGLQPGNNAFNYVLVVAGLGMVTVLAMRMLQAIRHVGFYAPLVFTMQFIVLSATTLAVIFFFAIILEQFDPPAVAAPWRIWLWSTLAILSSLAGWKADRMRWQWRLAILSIPTLCCAIMVLELAAVGQIGGSDAIALYLFYPVLGVAIPFTLLVYSAVFANSVPDWLSIAWSRTMLTAAIGATRSADFIRFLGLDVIVVTACCLLTLSISLAAFGLAYLSNWVLVSALGADPAMTFVDFFAGGLALPTQTLTAGSPLDVIGAQPSGPAAAGQIVVSLIFLVGLTSAIPTILNAIIMLMLIVGRLAARLLGPRLLAVHGLLVFDDNTPNEQRTRRLTRSTTIIGLASAALLAVSIYVIDTVSRMANL